MIQLLLELGWKSGVVAGGTLLVLAVLRDRSAAEKSWAAHAGLAIILVLPVATLCAPQVRVPAPPLVAQVLGGASVESNEEPPFVAAAGRAEESAASPARAEGGPARPAHDAVSSPEQAAALLYFLPMLLLCVLTIGAVARLHNLRSRARIVEDPDWLSASADVQRSMGWKHGAALLVSGEVSSPVSWGFLRPVIVIDEASLGSATQARAIVAHELAHVARLDWAKLILGRACTALYWANPLVWLLAGRCHQLREEAADDAVLRGDVTDVDYADLLIGSARRHSLGGLLAMSIAPPGRASLKQRVARVLDPSLRRTPANALWSMPCAMSATLLAALIAGLSPAEGSTREASPPVPRASSTQEASPPVPQASFTSLELKGDGAVTLRHGPVQRVQVAEARPGSTRVSVNAEGILTIDACVNGCPAVPPVIDITTPSVAMAAVSGRGLIRVEGQFPPSQSLALAVTDGGVIDAFGIRAVTVGAAVTNGGLISTSAQEELHASVTNGGKVQYCGQPASVASLVSPRKTGSVEKVSRSVSGC